MLKGEKVDLRVLDKEGFPFIIEWFNQTDAFGRSDPAHQFTKDDVEDMFNTPFERVEFIVETKEGRKVGMIGYYYVLHPSAKMLEVGYSLLPSERGKGYGTEALGIMVDYLFLSKDAVRIQAQTDPKNVPSQRILEKVGFKKEGVLRRSFFVRGEWVDSLVYSILREEWKGPRILKE